MITLSLDTYAGLCLIWFVLGFNAGILLMLRLIRGGM